MLLVEGDRTRVVTVDAGRNSTHTVALRREREREEREHTHQYIERERERESEGESESLEQRGADSLAARIRKDRDGELGRPRVDEPYPGRRGLKSSYHAAPTGNPSDDRDHGGVPLSPPTPYVERNGPGTASWLAAPSSNTRGEACRAGSARPARPLAGRRLRSGLTTARAPGCSMSATSVLRNAAPSAPSIARWSHVRATWTIGATSNNVQAKSIDLNRQDKYRFMQFSEEFLTNKKGDPQHNPSVNSCLVRIPGTINSKCAQEVKIIQRWNGERPAINYLLRYFQLWLINEKMKQRLIDNKRARALRPPIQLHSGGLKNYCILH